MSVLQQALLISFIAGLAIPIGALIACVEHIQSKWLEQEVRHFVIAFGGGTLLSAVAFILVPQGIEHLPLHSVVLWFIGGSLVFFFLDRSMAAHQTSAAQFLAMLIDFIPEAIALGAAFTIGEPIAFLLAFLLITQNIPEGFNAYREIISTTAASRQKVLAIFFALTLLGPLSAYVGMTYFSHNVSLMGGLMLFCSGGILYLTFQDIAPAAKLENHWGPALGACGGFVLGLVGFVLTQA